MIEKWYPTLEEGTNKGILLVVTASKDGALTGGPSFLKAIGDPLIDSLISDDIPILTEQEKFNEVVLESTRRIEAVLTGKEDPGDESELFQDSLSKRVDCVARRSCSRREEPQEDLQDQI